MTLFLAPSLLNDFCNFYGNWLYVPLFLAYRHVNWNFSWQIPLTNPYPGPRSVLVLDNCNIHHSEEVRKLVEDEAHKPSIFHVLSSTDSMILFRMPSHVPSAIFTRSQPHRASILSDQGIPLSVLAGRAIRGPTYGWVTRRLISPWTMQYVPFTSLGVQPPNPRKSQLLNTMLNPSSLYISRPCSLLGLTLPRDFQAKWQVWVFAYIIYKHWALFNGENTFLA